MNSFLKKILSGLLSASMLFSAAAAVPVFADDELPSDGLLVDITFDEDGTGTGSFEATAGGTVTEYGDVAYTASYEGNNALYISSNEAGNYLELPDGLLAGCEAATFSFKIKPSGGWAFMTTPDDTQTYLYEEYLGMLATGTYFTAERYNNDGTRLSSITASGDYSEWQSVAVVFEADGTKVYVNGKLAASDTAAVDIESLFTSDASTWIGHGNWGSGEGFSGKIDDFKLYGRALGADEIALLSADIDEYATAAVIYENNSIISETHFYDAEGTEIFSLGSDESGYVTSSVSLETTLKNYTSEDDSYTCAIYSVAADGTETQLTHFDEAAAGLPSLSEADITDSIDTSAIPADCEKLIARVSLETAAADCDAVLYTNITSPQIAPADLDTTTNGVHDPSIVKFDNDDTYYVYSSHHLIFTSEDLINWTKYDFTDISAAEISPITDAFISSNYTNTTINGTYWAPDVIYREDDDHPYWMYISVSCGLGGRNSVISLMKSTSPLFWADENADIEDAGIVFATKESDVYITNSIDANIYTDSNDGNVYFIWGSFWGGIQAAPLTDEGFVDGIDYTDDSTILSSCQNFGTSIFTQKYGTAGPEGAWMFEHNGYRYLFTSYGWLGSNYNTRVARASLETKFSENMGTQLLDANDVVMGTEYTKGSTTRTGITGYKLIGSYRLGGGTMTMTHDTDNNEYYYARTGDDAHVYYGPGHNSAIATDMGDFYVSHTRKDAIEGAATLQIRKILWTADGWPVVSPVTYAGEVEQALPEELIVGTYDLASVGYTKMEGSTIYTGTNPNRNYDLPVVSSKVTLNADGTMADGLGTWEFDGDHTVTLTFAVDGDTSLDEFYEAGDVMTMYALFGYDKDESSAAVALTGTDQNHVTQFAKKLVSNTVEVAEVDTTPIIIEKSAGGNPILGFDENGDIMYAGDPAALVDGDTVYIYAGHDSSTGDSYVMPEWVCYSSKDMENWTYEGVVMKATDVSWRSDDTSAWASQVVKYGGKYYLYYCTWGNSSTSGGYQCIGVAVSDSPTGPFEDIGAPIVNGKTMTTENTSGWNDIDPTVWVETVDGEEHRYLAWGNSIFYVCELNEDMESLKDISGDGSITSDDIKTQEFTSTPDGLVFTEAPWIYRQQDEDGNYTGKYYMFGAFGWREQMGYVTSDSMYGPWEAGGIIMEPTATSNTNHPSVIDFNGKTYFIYHNGSLSWGSGFRRVVCVEELTFNEDGSVNYIPETSTGLAGTASTVTQGDDYLYYEAFSNPTSDDSYPLEKSVSVGTDMDDLDTAKWEIVAGKADSENEYYVSIQAVNKPGLYLCAEDDKTIVLTADSEQNDTDTQKAMTFKTVEGLDGTEGSVSFESVSQEGYFITADSTGVTLTKGSNAAACTFTIGSADDLQILAMSATVDKAWYEDNTTVHFRLNKALIYDDVYAYIAEYDSDDTLIGVAVDKIDVTSSSQFVDISYARKQDDSNLRLYVWKDMLPVAEITDITETSSPYTVPEGYTSYFSFDEDLSDSVSSAEGEYTASLIGNEISDETVTPTITAGYKNNALSFTGTNSGGVNLGTVITDSKYTIAFRMKANAFTACTSGVFINSGDASTQEWVSAPFGSQSGGGTMIWSYKSGYLSVDSNSTMTADTWHHIAVTADGDTASLYIDGSLAGSGTVADIVTSATNTYLGVNFWDTPFNGLIDELYIYNGTTFTSDQIENLYFATK